MSIDKGSKSLVYLYGYIILALWGLGYLSKYMKSHDPGSAVFIILPAIWIALTKIADMLIGKYLSGFAIGLCLNISKNLRWGIGLFLILFLFPQKPEFNMVSYGILLLTFLRVGTVLIVLLKNYIVLKAVLNALSYLIQGIILKLTFTAIWKDGMWDIGFKLSISDMLLYGFITLAACSLLSLLKLSRSTQLKNTGEWFETGPVHKFLYACLAVLLLKDVRIHFSESIPGKYIIVEWFLIFLILLIFLMIMLKKTKRIEKAPMAEDLKRQTVDIRYMKGNDLKTVSGYIDGFVEKGDKSEILTYLVYLAHELDVPEEAARNIMVLPLLAYEDTKIPLVHFKRELEFIENKNKERRRTVLNGIIADLKRYGGYKNAN